MLSVAIVGGLHADARRQAVERLLVDVPGAVALHHDLSTAVQGTVVRTVRDHTGIVSAGEAPLVNDCACCALREDLVPELERLAADGLTRLAIVELWDSVEPKAMAEVVASAGLHLTGVITAVDPALVLPYLGNGDDLADAGLAAAATDQRTVADTFARQLEYAPVLALADSEEADDEDRALLVQLHPTARQVPIGPVALPDPWGWESWFAGQESAGRGGAGREGEDPRAADSGAAPTTDRPDFEGSGHPGPAGQGAGDDAASSEGRDGPGGRTVPTAPEPAGSESVTPEPVGSALAELALAGFDVEAAAAAQHPACALLPAEADECGVSTLVWHRCRPFHPERLYAALEDLTCAAARSRGRFWLADRPDTLLHWDAAGGALCVESAGPWLASLPDAAWDMVPPVRRAAAALDWHPEHGDCCQHLVFTSPGLDRDGLELLLESCLLTDAEYAAGRPAWKRLPPAFDTLLEV
ncbi:GTP-binding protein [Streptomyces sp. Qhu-G9]|uniref:GTP-binding protein n=1 Tax=Streptomyces sp. Qhu-G9 TaxID=3452799 RepID=UPI0022AC1171|nr:GTP-binding protein [Streptomyces aurantiacus]WAU78926.1 GTP-binding protein [Streptomyces aurantiacus]